MTCVWDYVGITVGLPVKQLHEDRSGTEVILLSNYCNFKAIFYGWSMSLLCKRLLLRRSGIKFPRNHLSEENDHRDVLFLGFLRTELWCFGSSAVGFAFWRSSFSLNAWRRIFVFLVFNCLWQHLVISSKTKADIFSVEKLWTVKLS